MPPLDRKPVVMGPRKQAPEEFKARVRKKLAALGVDHRWLEARIVNRKGKPIGRGSVTKLLAEGEHTSGLVDPICELLGVDPPVMEIHDAQERQFIEHLRRMPLAQRNHLFGLIGLSSDEDDGDAPS